MLKPNRSAANGPSIPSRLGNDPAKKKYASHSAVHIERVKDRLESFGMSLDLGSITYVGRDSSAGLPSMAKATMICFCIRPLPSAGLSGL